MPLAHQTGIQIRPTGFWSMVEMIILWTCLYRKQIKIKNDYILAKTYDLNLAEIFLFGNRELN